MALPNPSMSFSPFAILTAEELNDLVENIESIYNGNLADGSISGSKLVNNAVTPTKLGGLVENLGIQTGSVTATPSGANVVTSVNVNFPVAFSKAPIVNATLYTTSDNLAWCSVAGVTSTGFTLYFRRSNTSSSNFTWVAIVNRD